MRDGHLPSPDSVPVDHVTLRRHNLAVVLRSLRETGPRSRARIAQDTGLTKATVSSLVGELVELGLVRDGEVERDGGVGRPGQAVELDGRICGLGVEVRVDGVVIDALDLRGEEVLSHQVSFDMSSVSLEQALDEVASVIDAALAEVQRRGLVAVGLTVALPGIVESAPGVLRHGPGVAWREVPVADELRARLNGVSCPIGLENDANLSALAEYVMGPAAGTADMVYLTGQAGVGAGVITGGVLLRGTEGYGGEVGHLPIGDPSHVCGCGRWGCWETEVGLAALFREVADPSDPVTDPTSDLEVRLAEIRRRAELGDGRTLRGLRAIGAALGLGATILVDLLNPRRIVLGGYFAVLGAYLVPAMEAELDKRALTSGQGSCLVEVSTLGFSAACRGGAHVVLETVLADPASTVRSAAPMEPSGGMT